MLTTLIESVAGQGLFVAMLLAMGVGFVATGVCPCTLPLGAGVAAAASGTESGRRRAGLILVAVFAAGMFTTTAVLGGAAGHVGTLLTVSFGRYWALAMALLTLAAATAAFLGPRLKVAQLERLRRPGLASGFLYGIVFSLGTATAPLLVLLAAAAAHAQPAQGAALGLMFGVGRAAPFLLIGLSAGLLTRFLQSPGRRKIVQGISGCVLLAASLYFGWVFVGFL